MSNPVSKWRKGRGYSQIAFYLPEENHKRFKEAARRSGRSLTSILREAVEEFIKETENADTGTNV